MHLRNLCLEFGQLLEVATLWDDQIYWGAP